MQLIMAGDILGRFPWVFRRIFFVRLAPALQALVVLILCVSCEARNQHTSAPVTNSNAIPAAGVPMEPAVEADLTRAVESQIAKARQIAVQKLPKLDPNALIQGCIAPAYDSRTSLMSVGVVVTFQVAGTFRTEKLGEMADFVIVVFRDGMTGEPEVQRISAWLREGILGVRR